MKCVSSVYDVLNLITASVIALLVASVSCSGRRCSEKITASASSLNYLHQYCIQLHKTTQTTILYTRQCFQTLSSPYNLVVVKISPADF